METLNNFASIYSFISFIFGAVFMLAILSIAAMGKDKEPRNKVRFFVARDKNGTLWLYLGKPFRGENAFVPQKNGCSLAYNSLLKHLGLNIDEYRDLKWEDEPVEVFLNLEN